jgi:glycosyltransferase involved in cell wall biosynthesis
MSKQKKILFILHIPPPIHGAAVVGKYINESRIINNSFNCKFINLGTSITVDEVNSIGLQKWIRYFKIIKETRKILRELKPDLVYITLNSKGVGFYKDALVAFIAKYKGAKVVYHFHNKGVKTYQHKPIDNFLYQKTFNNSKVILLSKYLYPDIKKYVSEKNVYYCSNGIPEEDGSQKSEVGRTETEVVATNTLQPVSCNLLFLSNLIESKGVFVLLDACMLLQEKQVPFQCTFIGGEGDITEEQFESIVNEKGLESCVTYAGKKHGEEKEEAFSNADIFVHPTYEDCFPLVLLEAMQFSLPIVSSLEGGIPSIVENSTSGFLVNKKDAHALAEKLEILIKTPELRQKMGKAGRKKYEHEFTFEIFENKFKKILTNILKTST